MAHYGKHMWWFSSIKDLLETDIYFEHLSNPCFFVYIFFYLDDEDISMGFCVAGAQEAQEAELFLQ